MSLQHDGEVLTLFSQVGQAVDGDGRYLAPEVLFGILSKAADIFGVGIVMFELASGTVLPYTGYLFHKLRTGEFPISMTKGEIKVNLILSYFNQCTT